MHFAKLLSSYFGEGESLEEAFRTLSRYLLAGLPMGSPLECLAVR